MSNFYFNSHLSSFGHNNYSHHAQMPSHNHHGGRSRRAGRFSNTHNHRHRNNNRHPKEAADAEMARQFRVAFEFARSFDLEDDELFCPDLLTEDDLQSIFSSSSDRSSLSSGSPDSSPLQQQLQPTPNFTLPPHSAHHMQQAAPFQPSASSYLKMHQPLPQRTHKAIPIVNPANRAAATPPQSVSPAGMQKPYTAAHWQ